MTFAYFFQHSTVTLLIDVSYLFTNNYGKKLRFRHIRACGLIILLFLVIFWQNIRFDKQYNRCHVNIWKFIDQTFYVFHAFMFMSLIDSIIILFLFLMSDYVFYSTVSLFIKITSWRSWLCEKLNDYWTSNDFPDIMKLSKFHLRYYPPGINLEYIQAGIKKMKTLDLLDLMPSWVWNWWEISYLLTDKNGVVICYFWSQVILAD